MKWRHGCINWPGNAVLWVLLWMPIASGTVAAYNDLLGNRVEYGVGDRPRGVVVFDYDQDSDLDLAVTNFGSETGINDSITILLNDGSGIFQIDTSYIVGDGAAAICAGRFKHSTDTFSMANKNFGTRIDSYPDLAVINRLSDTFILFFNNWGQNLVESYTYWGGSIPSAICAAELRYSGIDDIIVGNVFSTEVMIWLSDWDGSLSLYTRIGVSSDARAIKAADLDDDNDLDLIVVTSKLEIIKQEWLHDFQPPIVYDMVGVATDAATADFDDDGDLDIAVTNTTGLIIWPNNGNGTFGTSNIFTGSNWPRSIAASDLDRDGDYDLVIADNSEDVVVVMTNDGNGNFGTEGKYATTSGGVRNAAVADFDSDGDDDVVAVNSGTDDVSILFGLTHTAHCVMEPDYVNAIDAYGPESLSGAAYVGDFDIGYPVEDIDPFSVAINGSLHPSSFTIVDDYPDIAGEVVRMEFDFDELIRGYGAVCDSDFHYYKVSGRFTDGTSFAAGGDIFIAGLLPGDANLNDRVDIGDAVFLVDFLFRDGDAPQLNAIADVTGDGEVDMADILFIINYIFKDGPAPSMCEEN